MKGMILAAGLGTRLLPLTQFIPKPLIPIVNIPMLRYCLESFHHFGIHDLTINTHHLHDQINRFLEKTKGFSFQISHEPNILGSFGGVRKMWNLIGNEPIISMNSDIVSTLDLHALINAHKEKQSLITIGLIPGRGVGAYTNVWVGKDGRILSIGGEAPKPEALRTHYCGIQILEPPIKGWLESGQYGELNPVVFQRALTEKVPFYGYVSQSLWLDGGSPTHLLNTNKTLLTLLEQKNEEFGPLFRRLSPTYREISPGIFVGKGTTFESTVELRGPLVIGSDCQLKGKGIVGPFVTIGDKVSFSNISSITESVVLPETKKSNQSFSKVIISPFGEPLVPGLDC